MSEDMMQFSVGPMIGQRLSLPWATSVIHTDITPDHQTIRVERELEGGIKAIVEINLPALLTIQSGINDPRYPSLSNLLRANKSRITTISADALNQPDPTCQTVGYAYPEKKRDGLVIKGTPQEKAETLLTMLREKSLI
jgi:electron transfer flavoprotein beta subunit